MGSRKDRKRIAKRWQKDIKRIEKGRMKDSSEGRIFDIYICYSLFCNRRIVLPIKEFYIYNEKNILLYSLLIFITYVIHISVFRHWIFVSGIWNDKQL